MNEQPPRAARRRLIDELRALSESLGDGVSAAVPAPEPFSPHPDAPPLLDLGAIFEDDLLGDDEAPLLFWPLQELAASGDKPPAPAPAADRAALIEQIVTRRLPDLERLLRDQLRGLDIESLKRLLC